MKKSDILLVISFFLYSSSSISLVTSKPLGSDWRVITRKVNSSLTLQCITTETCSVTDVKWYKGDILLEKNNTHYRISNPRTFPFYRTVLNIASVDLSDAGVYRMEANVSGQICTSTFNVAIEATSKFQSWQHFNTRYIYKLA